MEFLLKKENEETDQFRCSNCKKLIAKSLKDFFIEIKCLRCKTLNKIFQYIPEQLIITDSEGKILFLNKTFEKTTGYTVCESVGKKPSDLWGNQMQKKFYEDMWFKIKVKKESVNVKITNKNKGGEMYDVDLTVSPILDEKGCVLFFVGVEVVQ